MKRILVFAALASMFHMPVFIKVAKAQVSGTGTAISGIVRGNALICNSDHRTVIG